MTQQTAATLAAMQDALAHSQAQVLAHLPDKVRLKLTKLLLATAERTASALQAFETYQAHGTLTPSRGAAPRKKPRHERH